MSASEPWQPGATLQCLRDSARLRRFLRTWFDTRGALEVTTPVLSAAGTTDPNIQSMLIRHPTDHGPPHTGSGLCYADAYLHTSPEFAMKRLVAAYHQDIYQIVPVFRAGERGLRHNPEFTLLEWYRVNVTLEGLIAELCALFEALWYEFQHPWQPPTVLSYVDAVAERLCMPFAQIDVPVLQAHFLQAGRCWPDGLEAFELDAALDLFIDEFVLPELPGDRITVLGEYPASQSSLARTGVSASGVAIAERVELYWGRLELANGFHELCDPVEQRQRFEQDNKARLERGLEVVAIDEHLLAALASGLPACSGVAVGVERLLMAVCGIDSIQQAMSFDASRV